MTAPTADDAAPPAHPDRRALVVLVLGACVLGWAPILVRLTTTGPAAAGFWRLALAAPVLAVVAAANRGRGAAAPFPALAVGFAGVMFAADLTFWHYSIRFTSVANASVLGNLTPVFVTAIAWLVFRERPRAVFLGGLALALGGAALMALARHSVGRGAHPALGDTLATVTALWYGIYFLAVRRARETAGAWAVMLWSGLVGAPALLVVAAALHETLAPLTALGWAACAGLGLVHVIGQGAIAWALGRLPAPLAAVVVLVQPVVSTLLGWAMFAEAVTPLQGLGGLLALAGIVVAQRSDRRDLKPTPRPRDALETAGP